MASHYEQFQPVQSTGQQLGPIEFYRQSDLQQTSNQNPSNKRSSMIQQQQQQAYSASQKNFQEGGLAFDNNFLVDDASPIPGVIQKSNLVDNYSEGLQKHMDGPREESKRQMIDRQVASKRRSVESKEAITGNKQRDLLLPQDQLMQMNNKNILNGAKSSLGYYGTEQQQLQQQPIINQGLKQIGKNIRVQINVDMNNQQQKRTLAKSQSQNRLLLVSPETLLNKNHPFQDFYQDGSNNNQNPSDNKNSFYKDPLGGRSTNQPSDLLYKQHMQYSSGGAGGHKSWQLKASKNHLLSGMTTKSECTFCNKTGAGWAGASSTIIPPHQCSAIYCAKDQQGMMIQNNLSKKYSTNRDYYNLKIVNDLIYNENTHIVSIFKDYLILDDINEFLKRSYNQQETKVRLPKLCSFYDKYSQVFPNYVCLPESKYMFKNIQRKQKLIDEQYQIQEELAKKQHQTLLDEDKLFNTKFYNSYYSNMGDLSMTKKQYEEQAKQIATQAGKKIPTRTAIEQMRIDELVDRFLMKDSESNIQLITTAGLDFSGFTHGNSTFINPVQHQDKTPIKPETQKTTNAPSNNKLNARALQQPRSQNAVNKAHEKKPSSQVMVDNQRKSNTQQLQNANSNVGQIVSQVNNRRQKNSFNNNQLQQQQQQQQKNTKVGTYPGAPKLDAQRIGQSGANNLESAKTTPRLQKTNVQNIQVLQTQEMNTQNLKQLIQTSPGTKEAIQNYLNNHQLEENELLRQSANGVQSLKLNVNDLQKTHNLATMSSLLSPAANQNPTTYSESPSLKSPNQFNQKHLPLSGSQTALMTQQQLLQSNMNNNRANMKSQCAMPQLGNTQPLQMSQQQQQAISNLKKAGRLSGGGSSKQSHLHRKNISPLPNQQLQTDQQNTLNTQHSSRNFQVANNSTQKSVKSINSHAKYLSGGTEQYQKLLLNINNPNIQQNSYVTNYETMNSNIVNSSNKKLVQQRSKQDMILDTYVGTQNSQQKMQQLPRQVEFTDALDNDIITGEDCDDCGIADERFASPDGLSLGAAAVSAGLQMVYQTVDDQGRRSLEGTVNSNGGGVFSSQNPQQMLLLTSSDDINKGGMLLSQYDNFDQIKKHLEQQCINNKKNQQQVSYEQINSLPSGSKQYTLKSVEKTGFDEVKSSAQSLPTGYNKDFMGQSVISQTQSHTHTHTHAHTHTNSNQMNNQNSNDKSGSRNDATAQKQQYESIKQQIRGVYQQNSNNNNNILNNEQSSQAQSSNKTPNKASTHSKKSMTGNYQQIQNQQINLQQQQQQQQVNRMSLESANMLLMLQNNQNSNTITNPNVISQVPPPLTSTAANGQRQLSFSQASFSTNNPNYRSITNLQQRKTSSNNNNNNNNNKDNSNSVEKKRLSQNRQSFKELNTAAAAQQQLQQQQVMSQHQQQQQLQLQQQQQIQQTALNEQQKVIKRSVTGKTLNIYDSNSNSNTINPTYLQSVQNNASLCNPTFISNGSAQNKYYNTNHQQQNSIVSTGSGQTLSQQQQQAANTVRVMTPSYSLASLSKAISPTQMTSPMTMTVTLANNQNSVIGRKQVISSHNNNKTKTALGVHQNIQNQGSLQSMLVSSHSQNYLLGDKTQSKLLTSTSNTSNPMQKTIISSKAQIKSMNHRPNSTATSLASASGMTGIGMGISGSTSGLATTVNTLQIASTINQKLGRQQQQQQQKLVNQGHHALIQSNSQSNLQGNTPKNQINLLDSQHSHQLQMQQQQQKAQGQTLLSQLQIHSNDNSHSQNLSCTVSTENNSSKQYLQGNCASSGLMEMAAKALESKNPKFMRTIEEFSTGSGGNNNNNNNIVSRKSGGLITSNSHAQIDGKHTKSKVQTVVNSNQPSIKRNPTASGSILSQSASVSHFKSPSQQLNSKKYQQQQQQQMQNNGRY